MPEDIETARNELRVRLAELKANQTSLPDKNGEKRTPIDDFLVLARDKETLDKVSAPGPNAAYLEQELYDARREMVQDSAKKVVVGSRDQDYAVLAGSAQRLVREAHGMGLTVSDLS